MSRWRIGPRFLWLRICAHCIVTHGTTQIIGIYNPAEREETLEVVTAPVLCTWCDQYDVGVEGYYYMKGHTVPLYRELGQIYSDHQWCLDASGGWSMSALPRRGCALPPGTDDSQWDVINGEVPLCNGTMQEVAHLYRFDSPAVLEDE